MPLAAGSRLGNYEILAPLGAGGMGEVYRAKDLRLGREVALKVLPAAMSADPERLARFEREARAVAGLNHPNIVTLHSVEDDGGVRFLTMELVEGQSLDRVIAPGGLPIARVIELGIDLADALAAAHEKRVVHRDLKPANVMLTRDGRVKVLDFGLAKLAEDSSERVANAEDVTSAPTAAHRPLTSAGMVVGTVPYMSPEQINGDSVDERTDLFSLGVLLYEMATGERPFAGRTPAETTTSILRDLPKPLSETRHDAPRDLQRILDHCLQKDPDSRFQTAKDVRNELRALRKEVESEASESVVSRSAIHTPMSTTSRTASRRGLWIGLAALALAIIAGLVLFSGPLRQAMKGSATPATGLDSKSIAVLPFVNMSSDKEQEYFSDGISEELLNLLSKIPEIKVAARTSSFSFKGKNVEIPEIARQLGVAHVLEGSVRKSGDQVRITAQLIHAADGFHVWSQTYDRRLDDIFKIQDEIAADVVRELKVTLLDAAPKMRTTDPRAYALYLQAVEVGRQFTPEGFAQSDSLLREVLSIDPDYAPAWGQVGRNVSNEANNGLLPLEQGFDRAREAYGKALAIDPDYAQAHSGLGFLAMIQGDFAEAAKHLERALALDPVDPTILRTSATMLTTLGRLDEAMAMFDASVRRDPLNTSTLFNAGGAQCSAGRFDAAVALFRAALGLAPHRGTLHYGIARALLLKGDAPGALAEMEQEPTELWRMIGFPMAYHAVGRKVDSDRALAALIAKYERDASYNIAEVYAFRGDADHAFEWLDKAVERRDGGLSAIAVERLFDPIRSDPRWLPFVRKIGKAPDQLAKISFKVTLPENP